MLDGCSAVITTNWGVDRSRVSKGGVLVAASLDLSDFQEDEKAQMCKEENVVLYPLFIDSRTRIHARPMERQ